MQCGETIIGGSINGAGKYMTFILRMSGGEMLTAKDC